MSHDERVTVVERIVMDAFYKRALQTPGAPSVREIAVAVVQALDNRTEG